MRTTDPITTKLVSFIPLDMLITWINIGEILMEYFCIGKYSLKNLDVFFFKVKLSFGHISGIVWSDWYEKKRKCIDWILGILYDLDLWPHSWPWWIWVRLNHSYWKWSAGIESWDYLGNVCFSCITAWDLGPLLLTWFNFNPSMDK